MIAHTLVGASIIFPSESFSPIHVLSSIQEDRPTALYGVPTMFIAVLDLLAKGSAPYTHEPEDFSNQLDLASSGPQISPTYVLVL